MRQPHPWRARDKVTSGSFPDEQESRKTRIKDNSLCVKWRHVGRPANRSPSLGLRGGCVGGAEDQVGARGTFLAGDFDLWASVSFLLLDLLPYRADIGFHIATLGAFSRGQDASFAIKVTRQRTHCRGRWDPHVWAFGTGPAILSFLPERQRTCCKCTACEVTCRPRMLTGGLHVPLWPQGN